MSNGMHILTPRIIKLRTSLHRMSQTLPIYMDLESAWTNSWQETSRWGLSNAEVPSEAQEGPKLQTARKRENILNYQCVLALFLQSLLGHPPPFTIRDWVS